MKPIVLLEPELSLNSNLSLKSFLFCTCWYLRVYLYFLDKSQSICFICKRKFGKPELSKISWIYFNCKKYTNTLVFTRSYQVNILGFCKSKGVIRQISLTVKLLYLYCRTTGIQDFLHSVFRTINWNSVKQCYLI